MKKKLTSSQIILIAALISSLVFTLLCLAGLFKAPDRTLADALYQRPRATSGDVIIIGINEDALEELGAYHTWTRDIMANALEVLASDPENMPAVVAIDTLYTGETTPEADAHLAEAASGLPCVVTASAATFGTGYVEDENGNLHPSDHLLFAYDEPYEALKKATVQGQINAMYDLDGILRHGVLYVDTGEEYGNERVYSMAAQAATLYAKSRGEELALPETDERGHFYISYTGMPGAYDEGMSIADLLGGRIPADHYADRIVLIGPYASGLQDEYLTPIDHSRKMYGIEVQANAIEAMLRQEYKKDLPDLLQALILFAVMFFVLWFCLNRKLMASSIVSLGVLAASVAASVLLYRAGWIIHPFWIPLAVLLSYLASIAIRYVRSAIEKRRVTKTFERYVAPEIVREILKEGSDSLGLGGRVLDIAVLFVDVRGFTTMSERLDPETVVRILNKYLTMASTCVEENHGTLDKFVGDAMMAFWGAPLPCEDPVYFAVRTALGIVEGAKRVSEELKEEIGEELRVGVGVHFGPAVVGNMGAERHMDYTAIGDTVNTSARLEANAPGGTVYVSRAVADALGDRLTVTSLGDTVKLKGKAEGFEVLRVESLKED